MQSIKVKSFIRISLGALVLAGSVFAQDPAPPPSGTSATSIVDSGLSFGLRSGYGVPIGNAAQNANFSDFTQGMIPIWADVGYRFNPNWYLGAFFQYGIAFTPSNRPCPTGVSCSLYDMRFGVNVHYHILPGNGLDPWVGLGAAYEIANSSASIGGVSNSVQLTGIEFANAQVGLDWEVSPNFSFGPFATFTIGQFLNSSAAGGASVSIANKDIHEWFIFGLRGVFNIGI